VSRGRSRAVARARSPVHVLLCDDGVMKIRFAVAPGPASEAAGLAAFATAVQTSGFDGIWLSDLPVSSALDPLLALALVAGRTTRLRLGANVVPLGRNPYLLAKELAQLDQLSEGRLLLSFVTGIGQAAERQALGLGGDSRGEVLEEVLALLRAWWAGEVVEHVSERWSFAGVTAPARPVQDPLEVWLGGRGPKALERVGRVADGWLGAQVTPEEALAARGAIDTAAARAGREVDPEHFGLSVPYVRAAPEPELLAALSRRRPELDPLSVLAVGGPALRTLLERYIEAGLSKFVIRSASPVDSWGAEAGWLAETILDLQT
jgi:probable F420-dependent oxidoreductase